MQSLNLLLLILLGSCAPWVNPLDFAQKIDAPRHIEGDRECERSLP